MNRLAAVLTVALTTLACAGVEAEPKLELPVPVDTGVVAEPEPEPGGPRCLSVAGRDVDADVRLVTEGRKIVGGSLSWVDRSTGTSGIAEPLSGSRAKGMMVATGPVFDANGKRSGTAELRIARIHGELGMAIDGEQVMGKVKSGPCGD